MKATPLSRIVESSARHYAKTYGLRLQEFVILTSRQSALYDGLCWENGDVGVALAGREPYLVLQTLAHELAHLAHHNHGPEWFRLFTRMANQMLDDGLLDKLTAACEVAPT